MQYFELPNDIGPFSVVCYSTEPFKRVLKAPFRNASLNYRVSRYLSLAGDAEVIHLQENLNAFGSSVAFRLLRRRTNAARVITVHELDPEQSAHPELNGTYNLADAIIVHDSLMKEKLVSQGVNRDLINVVCMGTDIGEFEENPARDGIVFYGAHNFNEGKGIKTLFSAYKYLKESAKSPPPRLRIHGHFGPTPPAYLTLVGEMGLEPDVEWLGDLTNEEIVALYRRSQVCVLPYVGSFAGLPVGFAAANRLPIIATKRAGIPDHIGDLGIWIEPGNPMELAETLKNVLADDAMRMDRGRRLRAYAEQNLGWDVIARNTMAVYRTAKERAAVRVAKETHVATGANPSRVAVKG
jgi:glycosyltransferase involved in cell wall biosynthesis